MDLVEGEKKKVFSGVLHSKDRPLIPSRS